MTNVDIMEVVSMGLNAYLKVLLSAFIPSMAAYIAQDKGILDFLVQKELLGKEFPVTSVKQFCLILSVAIVGLYFPWKYEKIKAIKREVESQRAALIATLKHSTFSALSNEINNPSARDSVSVRIWTKEVIKANFFSNICYKILIKLPFEFQFTDGLGDNDKIYFKIKNVEGLSSITDNTKDLRFEAYPVTQGLVGRCFTEKEMVYDEDTKNSGEDYNLNPYQKSKTDTRFVLCYPIFDEKNKVISIVSFDSPHKITIPDEKTQNVVEIITGFCQSLYENAPDLFK